MVNPKTLRSKRIVAGIAGHVLCKRLGIARSRLSAIERGYVEATPQELTRIDLALDDLIRAKALIQKTATAVGWPVSA
jgi:transcriptional regulator with XRE-family HTH domain